MDNDKKAYELIQQALAAVYEMEQTKKTEVIRRKLWEAMVAF
jgi:hypothetical protein